MLQRARNKRFEGKGEGSKGKLEVEGKGKAKIEDEEMKDLGKTQQPRDLRKERELVKEMVKKVSELEKGIEPTDEGKRGRKGSKRRGSRKGKGFRGLWADLSPRQIVCALPMLPAGEPFGSPTQKRWKKVDLLVDGKKVKRVLPKRGRVGIAARNAGNAQDVIEISSGSSSSSSDESDDSSSGDSSLFWWQTDHSLATA